MIVWAGTLKALVLFPTWFDYPSGRESAQDEVAFRRIGGVRCVGQRDITVGPDEVEGVPGKAGLAMTRSPGEDVQRNPRLSDQAVSSGRAAP